MRMLHAYLDHPALGCGYYRLLEIKQSKKWSTLFYPPTLSKVVLRTGSLSLAEEVGFSPREIARIIRRSRACYDLHGIRYSKKTVRETLRALKALPKFVLKGTSKE